MNACGSATTPMKPCTWNALRLECSLTTWLSNLNDYRFMFAGSHWRGNHPWIYVKWNYFRRLLLKCALAVITTSLFGILAWQGQLRLSRKRARTDLLSQLPIRLQDLNYFRESGTSISPRANACPGKTPLIYFLFPRNVYLSSAPSSLNCRHDFWCLIKLSPARLKAVKFFHRVVGNLGTYCHNLSCDWCNILRRYQCFQIAFKMVLTTAKQ